MRTDTPLAIKLVDYQQPDYWIKHTELVIRIFDNFTQVESHLTMERNGQATDLPALQLHGVDQDIKSLSFDDEPIPDDQYVYAQETLTVQPTRAQFVFKAVTHIKPNENTSLEGLYKSGSMICSQCEAEGFRKITFYLDRPDVMATFVTRLEADKTLYPVLLSNGNPVEQGELDDGRHFATWHDPFPKPSYLFAAVAGDLVRNDDTFTTMSGREVALQIFVEPKNAHKTQFALDSLKKSMAWDEQTYGREYDLDLFMIVASDYFNMGAMENKGLNIFNSAAVLASPETSSDARFDRIEAIVAHEYFHNWSGNRVTCRDWFQLTLKEGFTVYRDACFTADMHDATVKRINDVVDLQSSQFLEDAGPNAHPIQPQEYIEINNFYTRTVYEKGAEVIRMIATIIGADHFRKGSDLYFDRFDGQAVTTNDFIDCMQAVSGYDFTQFKRWYVQAGTPVVTVSEQFDAAQQRYQLTFKQSCKPTPGQATKLPFVIPIKMGLLSSQGEALQLENDGQYNLDGSALLLTDSETTVTFTGANEKPVASLLRDFSAPVVIEFARSEADWRLLATQDSNEFNRFDALQNLMKQQVVQSVQQGAFNEALLRDLVASTLDDKTLSHALKAQMLSVPSYALLMPLFEPIDAKALVRARTEIERFIAREFATQWRTLTEQLASTAEYVFEAKEAGRRQLQRLAMVYWVKSEDEQALNHAEAHYRAANNQTDRLNGLAAVLAGHDVVKKESLLNHFYQHWKDDTQMVETWLSLYASLDTITVAHIRSLMAHEAYDKTNPNKIRSVLGGFMGNFEAFHAGADETYAFMAEMVCELDALNPQVAARLAKGLDNWRTFSADRSDLMKAALQQILEQENLSPDVYELTLKALR